MKRDVPVMAIFALVLASCTAQSGSANNPDASQPASSSPVSTLVPPAVGGSIAWSSCYDELDPLVCARFSVPYDYDDPSQGEFSLKLMKRPANKPAKRLGSMLVNPGGPGFGGTYLTDSADSFFGGALLDVFDIVAWDPRGTGESTPAVDCISEYDPYFTLDPTPETPAERQSLIDVSREFAEECGKKSGEILPYISTNATARDMDLIRAALGEEKISYFGFSYGSELGATWATMFPTTVRAAVFDGAKDPTADNIQSGLNQAKGFETEFTKFLEQCSKNSKCAFYNRGNAEQAFDLLIQSLDKKPLVVNKNRAAVNQAVALVAVVQAMYSSSMWPELENALANAQKGDGSGLLSLSDDYYQRSPDGTYGNELEAFNAISCLDDPGPKTVEEADSYIPQFQKTAPRLSAIFTSGYGCVFWPASPDPRIAITGKGAGPIIVIGTTGDAATPLASSRAMTRALEDGRLIVVENNRHTGYGTNACVTNAVNNYLISTRVTFSEKSC